MVEEREVSGRPTLEGSGGGTKVTSNSLSLDDNCSCDRG